MTQPTFYLDLDRTLFRTENAGEVFAMIEKLYPGYHEARDGYARRAEQYVYQRGETGEVVAYYHDVAQWLLDIGLNPKVVFDQLAQSEIADGRFEYDGVDRLVHALQAIGEVKLLTYGEDAYQRCKARLCPSLNGIEVITTLLPKAEYLNANARDGDWMIDDKEILGVHPTVHVLRIVQGSDDPAVYSTLDQLVTLIEGGTDTILQK